MQEYGILTYSFLQKAIQLVSDCINTFEPRATFRTKRLLVIMIPEYSLQTMASNTSYRLLFTLWAFVLSVITESKTTRTKIMNNTSFENTQIPLFDDRRLSATVSSKTILNYCLLPKYSFQTSKKYARNIFPSSL